tara:strand:+ start:18277 stop:19635 length:1359 start_codon:yes stop_codon:yes gene_type:complete
MVDLRPLLFANSLMILLLITASFIAVNKESINEAGQISQITENTLSESISANSKVNTDSILTYSDKSQRVLASLKETEDASFAKEPIFADEQPLGKISLEETKSLNPPVENTTNKLETYKKLNDSPEVISFENSPPPAKEVITTGKLIVRSNVSDDTVLVNGKPYGPTKLDLELTPGNYIIEVAKNGFKSWKASVDIRRGTTQTINASLEQFTKVAFSSGKWENNIKTGEGHYLNEGKFEYTGSFVNGEFHGNGSIRYSNGMKYQGQWFEGKMQGKGTLTTTEGDTYLGELNENKFNGEGTLTKATGDIYTGFWIDGVLNGQGTLTTKQGLLYVGGFADNLFHGNGSLTYPNGGHYEGSFSNGMFHGKGVETYSNGKKYVGQFIDGLYHGNGEILNPNGSKITGTFKDGKPFGKATLTTPEGEVFTARSSEPGVCYRQKSYRATECPQLDGW